MPQALRVDGYVLLKRSEGPHCSRLWLWYCRKDVTKKQLKRLRLKLTTTYEPFSAENDSFEPEEVQVVSDLP